MTLNIIFFSNIMTLNMKQRETFYLPPNHNFQVKGRGHIIRGYGGFCAGKRESIIEIKPHFCPPQITLIHLSKSHYKRQILCLCLRVLIKDREDNDL